MKKLLIFGGIGLLVWSIIRRKTNAFSATTIQLKAVKFGTLSFPNLPVVITVGIKNPTAEPLAFNSISGTITAQGKQISTFSNSVGATIQPNTETNINVDATLSLTPLFTSILAFIEAGFKDTILIDTITNVAGINIPARQEFPINFNPVADKQTLAAEEVIVVPTIETPTYVQPEILMVSDTPGYHAVEANANGNIDPTGGVVITLVPNNNAPNTITTESGNVVPNSIPTGMAVLPSSNMPTNNLIVLDSAIPTNVFTTYSINQSLATVI